MTAPSAPSASALASRARAMLRARADRDVARGACAYFKAYETLRFYGVGAPALYAVESQLYGEIRKDWTVADAAAFCGILIRDPHLEAKAVGIVLLGRFHRRFDSSLLGLAERWLRGNLCANWATVDALASRVISPLGRRFPKLVPRIMRWTRSPNLWLRRAAAVTFVPLARRGERLDAAYAVAAALLEDREDLLHKATGWLLREAGRTDAKRLEAFLLTHGPRVPRTALRYAVERFSARKRSRILVATRGARTVR